MINTVEKKKAWLGGWTVLGEIAQRFEGSRSINSGTVWEKGVPGRRNN